ncbi:unnamed protein product [Didymodactylos carnosus]|uniref:Uncharacterized protein n=1 Tax=Didymodactylos carnosus TaxID=1234261 RepID=A0A815TJR5_9BILA|nr:unnamed protein product [Didymodactylos carnosus]CAF1503968.1 unnamed protein product [Didymodactylos carnosus]CAF4169479.1 unnamed protein product [Didymodactylos carnosus]CAF4365354.1 unnamed protein product [Didymodactylos carnosus]
MATNVDIFKTEYLRLKHVETQYKTFKEEQAFKDNEMKEKFEQFENKILELTTANEHLTNQVDALTLPVCSSKTAITSTTRSAYYKRIISGYQIFNYDNEFKLKYNNAFLDKFQLAYETWGELDKKKTNAVLIFTSLEASSHAKSHEAHLCTGWWEQFIGPGLAIDTNHLFVICCNHIGGCYGTTGPSSINPKTNCPYGSSFPILSVEDFVNAQFLLIQKLGIQKVLKKAL